MMHMLKHYKHLKHSENVIKDTVRQIGTIRSNLYLTYSLLPVRHFIHLLFD